MSEPSDRTSLDRGAPAPGRPGATLYRTAPPRGAPRIIETNHLSRRWLFGGWAALSLLFLLGSSRVQLECEREPAGGACVITEQSLLSRSERRVPIADLTGARIHENDDDSAVVLLTRSGEVLLGTSGRYGQTEEKKAMVEAVTRFVKTPAEARIVAVYGSVWSNSLPPWIVCTLIALGFGHLTRAVRIIVDRAGGVLRVERPTLPWGKETRIWPLSSVVRAEVEGGGDDTYRVALVLTDGARAPLTAGYSSGQSTKSRAADAINVALAEQDA